MSLDDQNALIGDWSATNGGNNPPGTDTRKEGDDQIRGAKGTIRRHFPNFTGTAASPKTVNASEDEINLLVGLSLTEQIIQFEKNVTKLLFYNDTAPPGWTIDQALDEHSVRLTKGSATGGQAGGAAGGSYNFSAVFTDLAEAASPGIGNHTLTGAQSGAAAHTHPAPTINVLSEYTGGGVAHRIVGAGTDSGAFASYTTRNPNNDVWAYNDPVPSSSAVGASSGHSHTIDLKVKWAACIVATKDP